MFSLVSLCCSDLKLRLHNNKERGQKLTTIWTHALQSICPLSLKSKQAIM